ncbi:hypothetical protein H7K23_20170, partial [Paracoccus yeei]|nr:hypothetical protein [Paracoccus yeei]
MAKGFAAGLVHGALACGAGLVALALILPPPQAPTQAPPPVEAPAATTPAPAPETPAPDIPAPAPISEPVPAPAPASAPVPDAAPAPEPTPQPPTLEHAPEPAETRRPASPATDSLSLPAGSGFARTGDRQPQAPAPLAPQGPKPQA